MQNISLRKYFPEKVNMNSIYFYGKIDSTLQSNGKSWKKNTLPS